MENEGQACGVCFLPYDTNEHAPKVLINCGHTLCSSCLVKILKSPSLRKCPLDNLALKETQDSLEKFPPNFALLALLERKKQNTCQVHAKKLKIFCLKDKVKICSECGLFGEHKGHPVKKIDELKAKGIKAKKDLEERLMKFEKNPLEKSQDVEILKKRCLGKIDDKFGEINKILKTKHFEWRKQIEDLFERNVDSENESLFKREVSKIIGEIDQALRKEDNLALLDQDFNSIVSSFQPLVTKEEVLKLSQQTSRMISCVESFLASQAKTYQNFDLLDERIEPLQSVLQEKHKQAQLSPENLTITKPKSVLFKTPFTFEIHEGFLKIRVENSNPIDQKIDFDKFRKMKKIKVKLAKYSSLFQGSNDPKILSEILHQLDNYTSLTVSFSPEGLTDQHSLSLLTQLNYRIQDLENIDFCFEQCKITDEPILFLCNEILAKAASLKYLSLRLGSTRITDKALLALAQSFSHLSKDLIVLRLGVEDTSITDEGIEKIFNMIKRVEELYLFLRETGVTDRSLKVLGNNVMPCMKSLKKFILSASRTQITIEGVNAVFAGVPKDIHGLMLYFEGINLSAEVISLFEEKVCPKLEVVENVEIRLEGKDLRAKMSKILENVRNEAAKNKKRSNKKE